ncbi:potassium channel family protein [Pseudonocardia abyssalis]|uniref:Potassium channel protein n=1 Tax=Pseudonocardia abyssalis TaxID=2792008 RepID=A0ABS6UK89_9PSEU|nr:NAD-binding protein [Pseudonocardia abyssalis]MBW0116445.1 potassium channel protein [Pseudonocardia abyssalis]MBW0132663.1 potassium channel protein [Pseudonocardia abyssalis]
MGEPLPSATFFLVMRRMRVPLITLIVIFAIGVLGLTLVPGRDELGNPHRMGFLDAFYFMSYTASTIGFGELPYPFTYAQRLWVTATIFLTVVGWAYAIGSLLALLRDRTFRQAVRTAHFSRKVARLREPFLLIAGYGVTGELLGRAFDRLGRRFVVLDLDQERIEALDLAPYRADVPGLAGDARDAGRLTVAGLEHPWCAGVLALTNDDEANLTVTMAAALLRPDLPVVARTASPLIADRMRAFGTPTVVNPFAAFGRHLRIALRAPATYQLMTWLESGPGAEIPPRRKPPRDGRWVVCGFGRFGCALTDDLAAEGLEVTVIEPEPDEDDRPVIVGDGSDPRVLAGADLEHAVGFVAATDNDAANLSLVAAARRANPDLFVAARQNRATGAPLFRAVAVDALLVPTEVVAHEAYAQLSTPLLWRFLGTVPERDDAWAADLVDRLTALCGPRLQAVWKVRLDDEQAPALQGRLATGIALGDLLRDPGDRDERVCAVVLLVLRGDDADVGPGDDVELRAGDELLLVGHPSARRSLDRTLGDAVVAGYVLTGRREPSAWVWRRLAAARR